MQTNWRKEAIDVEWVVLMSEAKALGLSKQEVEAFLKERAERKPTLQSKSAGI
ncbi:anti-repressor SinI family protein [Thalassobacillus hwangdonensis]|uniref:Anti-repressor SinI family protein n=1 Tax=Thalassobacillus hwangdonensis TaxID=546108 RepID=A0ABW3L6A7_9BACI